MPNRNSTCGCSFSDYDDHDEMLEVENRGVPAVVALLERAAEYADTGECAGAFVPPVDWLQFAAEHSWRDAPAVYRLFLMVEESWRQSSSSTVEPLTPRKPTSLKLAERLRFRAADAFLGAAGAVAALRGQPQPV